MIFGRPVKGALLKGRNNYLCWHRLGASAERRLDRRAMGERGYTMAGPVLPQKFLILEDLQLGLWRQMLLYQTN